MNAIGWLLGVVVAAFFWPLATVEEDVEEFEIYDQFFKASGKMYSVPWRWLKAICMNESSLGNDPLVRSGLASTDGLSYGIMQVTLSTAGDFDRLVTPQKLNNPEYSVRIAAQYLKGLYSHFAGDRRKTIMSYNQGAGNTDRGKEYAAEYYNRFVRNLNRVLEKQPGDEYE